MPTSDHAQDWALDEVAFHALVDAAPDGIVMAGDDGRILFANHQAEQLFGFGRAELVGRSVDELLPERLQPVHEAHRARYRADPRVRAMGVGMTLFGRRTDGTEFPVEISLSPLPDVGDGLRVVAVVRDVTERVTADERLRRAEQDLRIVEDRERIARDLHDVVIQKLFAAGMTVQSVAARSSDPEQGTRLNAVVDELDETIREIRSVIFSLQSDLRDAASVRADVLRICDDHRDALGFEPRIRFEGPVDAISERITTELLPAVREGLANVARHAGASAVELTVANAPEFVTLRVVDDGCGVPDPLVTGNGLRNLSERAARLGGSCGVRTRPEGGSILEWQVPNRV